MARAARAATDGVRRAPLAARHVGPAHRKDWGALWPPAACVGGRSLLPPALIDCNTVRSHFSLRSFNWITAVELYARKPQNKLKIK